MRRRKALKLAVSSWAIAQLLGTSCQNRTAARLVSDNRRSNPAQIRVDWETGVAETTPFTFGSNDYEITNPKKASDPIYQNHLAELGIGLIRIHNSRLSDRWSDPDTKTWNEAKIKAGYDASYPQRPTIIQTIPGPPKWMTVDEDGRLAPWEYDRYATFCAELVEILNQRQKRQIRYWEPFNEKDVAYEKAGKLRELWTIYNQAAEAMKKRDPQIKIGGPALTWDDPEKLDAFLATCRRNVDFISWHRYCTGDAEATTDTLMAYTPEYKAQVERFRAMTAKHIPDRKVPLLLGEYNINHSWKSGEERQKTHIGAVWFASVLKHLADAKIDMATSWHLKDGVYGLIDAKNNLRPAATVFAWGIKYLTGRVMHTESDQPFVEAIAISQAGGERSLLLINKSAKSVSLKVQATPKITNSERLPMFSLDADGLKHGTLAAVALEREPLLLTPYSLVLLRFLQPAN